MTVRSTLVGKVTVRSTTFGKVTVIPKISQSELASKGKFAYVGRPSAESWGGGFSSLAYVTITARQKPHYT